MYFPYLRGKQNELIAVRELLLRGLLSNNIIPIIEPVTLTSTLILTLKAFIKEKRNIAVIVNPSVGAFERQCKNPSNKEQPKLKDEFYRLLDSESIIKSVIMSSTANDITNWLVGKGIAKDSILVILNDPNFFDAYIQVFGKTVPQYVLIPAEPSFVSRVPAHRVCFSDRFNKRPKNEDYLDAEDEYFSDDCSRYPNADFLGFADYSTIGRDFVLNGFAPKAVVIHIVYLSSTGTLRIRHFVSTSNEDTDDPAGKFSEAVSKLVAWYKKNKDIIPLTYGLNQLIQHHSRGSYPSLGPVKKLSIMHHLEVVGRYLDN